MNFTTHRHQHGTIPEGIDCFPKKKKKKIKKSKCKQTITMLILYMKSSRESKNISYKHWSECFITKTPHKRYSDCPLHASNHTCCVAKRGTWLTGAIAPRIGTGKVRHIGHVGCSLNHELMQWRWKRWPQSGINCSMSVSLYSIKHMEQQGEVELLFLSLDWP